MEKPDKAEKAIRFGCGFIFALAFLGIVAVDLLATTEFSGIAVILLIAIFIGILAMKKGDSFWRSLGDRHWWW